MNKTACLLIIIAMVGCLALSAVGDPQPPKISAESAILVDAVSGMIIYEKNSHERRPPASTTKIMTAILALEHGNPDDLITASKHASETDNSSMHLKYGEQLTLNDLLYAMLLRSANDAAVCIAEHIGGNEGRFVEMMNTKAQQIGAKDTHFMNPNGLPDDSHYSTAYDLALIARYAIQVPGFNEYVKTKRIRINRSINTRDVTMCNTAKFLWKYYGADGIKTGHTKKAGRCFVGSATRDGWRIICVALGSKNAGIDTMALMDYAFKYYRHIQFTKKGQIVALFPLKYGTVRTISAVPAKDISFVVRKSDQTKTHVTIRRNKRILAPITKGETVGSLDAFYGNELVGSCDLVAAESAPRALTASIMIYSRNILAIIIISAIGLYIYGTAVAEAARRRRRRIAKTRRGIDNIGQSER